MQAEKAKLHTNGSAKAVNDQGTQSERFIAKARELGLDEREEAFDAVLTKVAKHKVIGSPNPKDLTK